jgi:uncharacterized membrane protein
MNGMLPTALRARPSLLIGIVTGAAALGLSLLAPMHWTTRAVGVWDLAITVTMILWLRLMSKPATPHELAKRSAQLDEGRGAILFLSVFAAIAALTAVGLEIAEAKHDASGWRGLRVAASIVTVALSWAFVHLNFALHYAHEFYGADEPDGDLVTEKLAAKPAPKLAKAKLKQREGLKFPGADRTPDYWDFLHFSFVIGVAAQTADIAIESRTIRRIVTWHGTIAFLFNTVVLAVTINLASSLF